MAATSLLACVLLNPLLAAAATTTSAEPSNPSTPSYKDDVKWLTAYLTIHSLSKNSYVYMYILWFAVAATFLALSIATWSHIRTGALGARWSKWALRRRTWRKRHALKAAEADARKRGVPISSAHRQPKALPSNAQLLSAAALVVVVLLLCFVGPDYIDPDYSLFTFSSSSSSASSSVSKRVSVDVDPYIAHYTIPKSLWTLGARTGGIAFALFPLVVVLALKAPPFALFAIPGLVAYAHDKTIRLHRYVGRLLWLVTTLHVVFWVVQACKDRREATGEMVIMYVWEYQKFRFAWVAYLSMTILMICSLDCVRTPHYELFYLSHILFTPLTLIFSALHHPQKGVWGWCAAALALWIGERVWRACGWVYVNGVFGIGIGVGSGGSRGKKGRDVKKVGTIRPYTYYTRPGEKDAPSAHRSLASKASLSTLTNPGGQGQNMTSEGKLKEQWEMDELRAPKPRRPNSGVSGLGMGMGMGMDAPTPSRPASSASSSSAYSHMHTNSSSNLGDLSSTPTPGELMELARVDSGHGAVGAGMRGGPLQIQTGVATTTTPRTTTPAYPPAVHAHISHVAAQSPGAGPGPRTSASANASRRQSALSLQHHQQPRFQPAPQSARPPVYAPPPGYALATLLPGRTVRLRLVTPGYQTWAPGQHFLVGIPAVSRVATHPFSVASVCDEQAALRVDADADADAEGDQESGGGGGRRRGTHAQAEAGRELVLLIRAKKGWTKRLWDLVSSLQSTGHTQPPSESLPHGASPPPPGTPSVVLRALVDGPFGSAGRTRWGAYASVLIVAGGSGVSFGMSVLEYVCLCLAGRDGRFLGGHPGGWGVGKRGAWVTQRVRFVWLVREYAHIQWCVGALRRCLVTVPTDALELNIFVSNYRPPKELLTLPGTPFGSTDGHSDITGDDGLLKPPAPRFRVGGNKSSRRMSVSSDDSMASDISVDSIVDSYFDGDGDGTGEERDTVGELGYESHVLDYTNFDGDDDTPLPGEHRLSRRIIKESKLRRTQTRKVEKAVAAKQELEERVAAAQANAHANSQAYAYTGHAKSPSDETYGPGSSNHISTLSAEPLLAYASSNPALSPTTSIYSAFSPMDRHPRASSPPPPPPFGAFGAPHSSSTELSPKSAHRLSGSSTMKSPSSESMLTPTSATGPAMRWLNPESTAKSGAESGLGLSLDAQEVRDLQVVSEWARPGKPKLGRILADEVEASKGRLVVACCGPTSLNALMRKLIAEQISPARVARGDLRGSIDFVAEDFEY